MLSHLSLQCFKAKFVGLKGCKWIQSALFIMAFITAIFLLHGLHNFDMQGTALLFKCVFFITANSVKHQNVSEQTFN